VTVRTQWPQVMVGRVSSIMGILVNEAEVFTFP